MSLKGLSCLRSCVQNSGTSQGGLQGFFHPVRKARIQQPLAPGIGGYRMNSANHSSRPPKRVSIRTRHEHRDDSTRDDEPRNVRPPRRQDAYPQPRSTYSSSPAPSPRPAAAARSVPETVTFLHNLFQPHLPLSSPFPDGIAQRIVTHASWNRGLEGHNGRFMFLGRRILNAFLVLFLTSRPPTKLPSNSNKPLSGYSEPEFDIPYVIDRLLDTYSLGQYVGQAWNLEDVMRWSSPAPVISASPEDGSVLRSSGLYKVRGACVEAVMGGIYHQYGGLIAHRVFHTHVLPHLTREGLGLPRALVVDVQELQKEMLIGSQRSQLSSREDQENTPEHSFQPIAVVQRTSAIPESKSNTSEEPRIVLHA